MKKVPETWLATQANKLQDMNDLLIIQECVKEQQSSDWWSLNLVMDRVYQAGPRHRKKRRVRYIERQILERKLHVYPDKGGSEHLYRLAGLNG